MNAPDQAPSTATAIDLQALEGKTIADRFRLDAFLAEGCFGGVFRATHRALGTDLRTIALKISKRPMFASEARHAFADALLMVRVADAVADTSLRRHFVTVHDAGLLPPDGPASGHPFVAMEFVAGTTLGRALKRGPFPLTRAVHCFRQLLQAMALMHQPVERPDGRRGPVLHRDLKPENILLTRDAEGRDLVKLTDFGCAFELRDLLAWTTSGGDLAYVAPESFVSDHNSPASDVYMLALVAYEMLVGNNPFSQVGSHLRGDSEARRAELQQLHLEARQRERFHGLASHPELKPYPGVVALLRAALEPDPASRPVQDARAFLESWTAALKGPSESRPEETPPARVRRLLAQAEAALAAGDATKAAATLAEAQILNRDLDRVPNHLLVGAAYLMEVRQLLVAGQIETAQDIAAEGYSRRRCRTTCQAVALACRATNPDLASIYESEAAQFPSDP